MLRSRANNPGPVAGGLLIVATLVLVAACGAAAPSPAPASPAPSAPAPASPAPATPAPTPDPSAGVGDEPIVLDVADGHDVSVVVTDRGAGLVGAESGKAADGMSVRWGDAIAKNVDPNTIQVTWVGLPQDETIGLVVESQGNGVLLRFGQGAPYENSDAMGADRLMVFTFAQPVSADDVVVEFTTADD